MATKLCSKCKTEKNIDDFSRNKRKKDGRQTYCKVCASQYDSKYYHNNIKAQVERNKTHRNKLSKKVDQYKLEHGCKHCNEIEPCCLDFHHVRDNKEIAVSILVKSGCTKRAWSEISKCDIVCANCHRKIHAGIL